MADIRIKDLPTTASQTASDDFIALDGTVNGTRKIDASAPSFKTSVTSPSVAAPAATNLTLAGGSSGASLVLGQGIGAGSSTITNTGTGSLSVVNGDYFNVLTLSRNSSANNTGTTLVLRSKDAGGTYVDIGAFYAAKSAATIGAVDSFLTWSTRRAGTLTDAMTLTGPGNLLIGTTTDISGTGGLKVAGTSTASSTTSGALQVGSNVGLSGNAGGASYFGGDINVNSTSGSNIIANDPTFNHPVILLREAGVNKAAFETVSGDAYVSTQTAGKSLYLRSGNATTALTLASTGAATFAGAVTGKLITTQADDTSSGFVVKRSVNPYIDFYDGGTSGTIRAEISATNDGVSGGTLVLAPRNAAGTITTALTLTKDLAATFAGTATLYTVGASSTGENSLIFTGADGNGNVRTPAKITGKQAGNGGYGSLVFQTAFNNSLVDALTINSSQAATFAGAVLNSDGTAAAPSLSFSADSDTGFYSSAANTISVSVGGARGFDFSGSGFTLRGVPIIGTDAIAITAGGTNRNITLTPSGTGSAVISAAGTGDTNGALNINASSSAAFLWTQANMAANITAGQIAVSFLGKAASVNNSGYMGFLWNSNASNTNGLTWGLYGANRLMSLLGNGRLLVGTTIDSGALLQVGTNTTTSAGGIGFGTDVSLYRYQAGGLSISSTSGAPALTWAESGINRTFTYFSAGHYLGTYGAHPLIFQTNTTTALTLDTSQNATFAGKVAVASGTAAAPTLTFSGDSDTGIYNPGGNQLSAACAGSQIWNTTTNGLSMAASKDIYLGNAYIAGAPTATGYVTIKDSAGVTYKVLVST